MLRTRARPPLALPLFRLRAQGAVFHPRNLECSKVRVCKPLADGIARAGESRTSSRAAAYKAHGENTGEQSSVFPVRRAMQSSPRVVQVATPGGSRGGKGGGRGRGGKQMTLSERFSLLKKAAVSSPKPGQQGVKKQDTPNKQGKGNGNQGNAQAKGGQAGGKGGRGGKGKRGGKANKVTDHATLDQQLDSHMSEAVDGAAAAQ